MNWQIGVMIVLLIAALWGVKWALAEPERRRRRTAARDRFHAEVRARAGRTLAEGVVSIRSAILSPPEWWQGVLCEKLGCLARAELWAYDSQDCNGCYCMWRDTAPNTGETAGVCEHLIVDGPDGQELCGELAYAWGLYQSRDIGSEVRDEQATTDAA